MKMIFTALVMLMIVQSVTALAAPPASDGGREASALPQSESVQSLHLSTNMLYDLALVPNIGIEYSFSDKWSAKTNMMCAWWSNEAKHKYWRVIGGSVELKRWLGNNSHSFEHKGHHAGVYVGVYLYDFEPKMTSEMADFNYATGLTYGYSWKIGRRLSLDATLGVGYIGGNYKKYIYEDGKFVWLADMKRNYLGLTKAELSLVLNIGLRKKGGKQ